MTEDQAPPVSSIPLVELVNATISRANDPSSVRLRNVDWKIQLGEFWLLAAPSSSGKSDVLATAASLQRPLEGVCLLQGRDMATLDETSLVTERRRIGYVFEGGGRLFHHLSVRQNIELPFCYNNDCDSETAREWGNQLIEALQLQEHADALPGRLGRAVQQRVALGRALALEPEVLFLDDPAAGLDPRQTRWWFDFLGKLAAGSLITKGRKLTLVLGASELRTFGPLATHFALIRHGAWFPAGLKANVDPSLATDDSLFEDEPVQGSS